MIKSLRIQLRIVSILLIAVAMWNSVYLVALLGMLSLLISFTWLYMPEEERIDEWANRIVAAEHKRLAMEQYDPIRYAAAVEKSKQMLQSRKAVL